MDTLEFSGWTFLVLISGSVVTIRLHHSILFCCRKWRQSLVVVCCGFLLVVSDFLLSGTHASQNFAWHCCNSIHTSHAYFTQYNMPTKSHVHQVIFSLFIQNLTSTWNSLNIFFDGWFLRAIFPHLLKMYDHHFPVLQSPERLFHLDLQATGDTVVIYSANHCTFTVATN